MSYPYLARTTLKYKSPHATDLSFAKDETIRVTGPSEDDEDWLIGETLDGSKSGGFPKDFITPIEEPEAEPAPVPAPPAMPTAPPPEEAPASLIEPVNVVPIHATAPVPPSEPVPAPPPADPVPRPPSPAPKAPDTSKEADPDSPAKPQSMKDRLAFFKAAQNKAAPPPPVKPKPATGGLTWSQRQKLRQEQEAKEAGAGATAPVPAAAVLEAKPTPPPVTDESKEESRMSAADAQSSISKGGSLRERMAALQGAGAFGQPEEKPTPPKPSGKVWHRPPAPPEPEPEEGEDGAPAKSPLVEEGDGLAAAGEAAPETEGQTEEEEEKAKRAAIAARMAKLGARGPMGMAAPPKPARKPTKPAEVTAEGDSTSVPESVSPPPTSPPLSIPIAAIPRRTAPPRRKATTPATQQPSAVGTESPPPQVMVANEEKPLPKTEEQLATEKEQEAAGAGPHGAAGAEAAGIAMMPALGSGSESAIEGGAGIQSQPGEIISSKKEEPQELEDGLVEGGAEKDDVMQEAQQGDLEFERPVDVEQLDDGTEAKQIGTVPLHSPAEIAPGVSEDEEEAPPPPPPRIAGFGKDEVEMKHQREAEEAEAEAPPVPTRSEARPHPSLGHDRALPKPPAGNPMIPPRDEEEEEREVQGLGDEETPQDQDEEDLEEEEEAEEEEEEAEEEEEEAPPPPPRKPTLPPPIQTTTTVPSASPTLVSPKVPPLSPKPKEIPPPAPEESDADDAARRKGIAARMAKLGGIKFGAPPVTRKQSSLSSGQPQSPLEEPTSPVEAPMSPVMMSSSIPEDVTEETTAAASSTGDDETPDQESARRRATLARLRAGGTLGFGMFGHGPAAISSSDDTRGLEQELETQEAEAAPPPPPTPSKRTSLPPPPADEGPRSPPYSPRQSLPPPPAEEEEDAPPPPVPAVRPPQPSTSPVPLSPSTPTRRPPIPASEKRYSQHQPHPIAIPENAPPPPSQSFDSQLVNEPAVMMMNEQSPVSPPLPPPIPPISTRPHTQPESPRRSMSAASRVSRTSTTEHSPVLPHGSPASRQPSRQEAYPTPEQPVEAPRPSMNQGRPGYDHLVAASRDSGARLARAAKAMFDQGKRGHFGDGSSAGFVMVAIDQAQLARPTQEWGQVVFEQEGSSVMKRYDEPRPGDIAAFYDAKLKGKKGLAGYSQHVGSVEEPLLGVVVEFESKHKQKMRVLQVERGVPEEVSYRCEDLKSGKVIVYRVGL